ncbi:tetratricopeptide repeat protein 14 homolog isoform X2 [Bradysia coprophila]|uniref:tetratricopeptide repeat protein 14 homolog isoform X2 n=1 Tax=Bradysia coprophila TaxID=38358 RepID=UPI00187DA896|nr:tetratricopeptide repeat protein 14 homolog isoform X2 [Bradysia coprophila]
MDDNALLNPALVAKSIGFHGQPLQKIWEGERGDVDLLKIGVVNPDYTSYQMRQKHFTFQNRAKRLRLHQFIAKNANLFFRTKIDDDVPQKEPSAIDGACTTMPPYDSFFFEKMDKSQRLKHVYSLLQIGDVVYGTVHNKINSGMFVKLLCTGEPTVRFLGDLTIRAFLPMCEAIPAIDRKGTQRSYITNDNICCELIEKNDDSEKLVISMRGAFNPKTQFGLVTYDHFPELYKSSTDLQHETYENILEASPGFKNPNSIDCLFEKVGLNASTIYTNMSGLNGKFPAEEYGSDLRQVQASKWAFRSVAEGIEHFKLGRHTEAFQCLNKALSIDPRNVEGLVARGALFANSGSFKKAVDDFDNALKLNPGHANARRYKGETLVALGRSYEEENKIDDAMKAYQNCLTIIPRHEEAQKSLDFLRSKKAVATNSKQLIEPNELTLPALNLKIAEQNRDASTSKKEADPRSKDKKNKKKKSKNRKRRNSSSTSSSDSSDSSESSSGSDSDSSDSTSSTDSEKSKKKGRSRKDKRLKSLSPLSKRMALMPNPTVDVPPQTMRNFNDPFVGSAVSESDEYEARVRKFLELTRDEENFEEKVRKCVEETNKYCKERKLGDEKSKKREKKKSRKMKKDSKKKKKEKKSKSQKRSKDDIDNLDKIELREALKIITASLPGFDIDSIKASNKLEVIEKSLSAIKESNKLPKPSNYVEKEEGNKWSMMFAKDDKIISSTGKSMLRRLLLQQHPKTFPNNLHLAWTKILNRNCKIDMVKHLQAIRRLKIKLAHRQSRLNHRFQHYLVRSILSRRLRSRNHRHDKLSSISLAISGYHHRRNHLSQLLCHVVPVRVEVALVHVVAIVAAVHGPDRIVEVVRAHIEAEVVVLEADPDHFPDHGHVQEAWIVDGTEDQEEAEAVTIVERITNPDLDSVVAEAVVVEDTETSEIIVIVTIAVVVGTEDGWAMVVEVVVVPVVAVSVIEVVNEGAREAVLMTVSIVNAVRMIVTGVPTTMRKAEATGKIPHQQVVMPRKIGTKVLKRMHHRMHVVLERMRVWRKLRR